MSVYNQLDKKPFYFSKINISSVIGLLTLIYSILELQEVINIIPKEYLAYLIAFSSVLNVIIVYLRTFENNHKNLT